MKHEVETRFNVGDDVWILDSGIPRKVHILGIIFSECEYEEITDIDDSTFVCRKRGGFHYHLLGMPDKCFEGDCYATKVELVQSLMKKGDKED